MSLKSFGLFLLFVYMSSAHNEFLHNNIEGNLHPSVDFHEHTTFEPILYHGKYRRRINTTKEQNGRHAEHIVVKLILDDEILFLDLVLNKQLISSDFFHKYQKNGTDNVFKHTQQDLDFCEYHGKVRDKPNSWVALSTCNGLNGVIYDGNELHYVSSRTNNNPNISNNQIHYFYKHSNLAEHNKTCGYHDSDGKKHDEKIRQKRDTLNNIEHIRGPYNANRESKYVELVLVIDNREFKELGENRQRVIQHCKTIANIINGLYSPLNIFIALVGVVIWTERDEISFSKNGDETLTNFLHYRREKLIKEHPNDNAQLLSKFNFDNGVVGKALKGPICTYEYSGGVNTDHSPVVGLVATTIAHEMGHNFGMEHDTNDCKCPESRCIMAPSSSTEAPIHWSSCSLNYLLLAFTHGMDYCLKNKPESLFDSPVCGNGFVEPGEQCDCGLPEHCDNSCCNPNTCMLYANASCATGECCDLTTCMPKSAGVECRSADYECDLPEYCTGQSEFCPPDVYKMDTELCDDGKAYCYHGFCRTRTDQCKLLWGETGKSSDEQCYRMNTKGTRHGNCGYNKFNKSFTKCQNESVLCGMLHCLHLNERLEFGMESVAILSQSFINSKGTIIPCRNAIVDLGINQIDPGLAPDGATCGQGKMCVKQRCMSVESLRRDGANCPNDCNGNGWCNNLGHCHCKSGFSPPFCQEPGVGGSEDSGPASDPNKHQVYINAMFIFFLGIVPAVGLGVFLHYYLKRNGFYGNHIKSLPSISKSTRQLKTIEDGNNGNGNSAKKTEDNHSLLRDDSPSPPMSFQIGFFGRFKISLMPAKETNVERLPPVIRPAPPIPFAEGVSNKNEPIRPAPIYPPQIDVVRSAPPPPPTPTPPVSMITSKSTNQSTSSSLQAQNARADFFNNKPNRVPSLRKYPQTNPFSQAHQNDAPALPPLNPNQSNRPIISSPILESSTSTAKELMSPVRKAPIIPIKPQVTINDDVDVVTPVITETTTLKKSHKDGISLNRIASFLKNSDAKSSSTLQHRPSQIKANKIDREQLRSMEISNPIPQSEIDIAKDALPVNSETTKNVVILRSKSMRNGDLNAKRPAIPTFGSMRNPSGFKRPVSIPCGVRPKIPPPPRPPPPLQNQYDDCLNKKEKTKITPASPMSTDNIYAVIEDPPAITSEVNRIDNSTNNTNNNDSFGLLGEIVSEIKNRNYDSIYSTSTLARRKKEEKELASNREDENMSMYTENTYSNMSSSTASYIQPPNQMPNSNEGYVQPSSIPKPVEVKTNSKEKPTQVRMNSKEKLNETVQKKETSVKQTTVRSRRASPSGSSVSAVKNRLTNNSPDLVTSCNSTKSNKPPDVLNRDNSNKKPTVSVKPNVNNKVTSKNSIAKSPAKKSVEGIDKKEVGKDRIGVDNKLPNRSSSRVAALQKKFQN